MVDKEKLAKVMERIRKLLALAKSSNEHEAARAADIAQAMLAEYNLNEEAVVGTATVDIVVDGDLTTDPYPWRRPLASQVAKLYFCKYFYTTHKNVKPVYDQHSFVGQRHNIVVAKLMFEYLIAAIDRLAREGARGLPEKQRSPYRVSFRTACAGRLCHRIADRIEAAKEGGQIKTESGTTLPALLDLYEQADKAVSQFISDEIGELTTKTQKLAKLDEQALLDGDAAGESISLDRQVGGQQSGGRITTTKRLTGPSSP